MSACTRWPLRQSSLLLPCLLMFCATLPAVARPLELEFAKRLGGTGSLQSTSVAVDSEGHIYTLCWIATINPVDLDPGPDEHLITPTNHYTLVLSKLNAEGEFVWAKAIGANYIHYWSRMTLDAAGNIYVTGGFRGTADFDPGEGVHNITVTGGYTDVFVFKWTADGAFVWAKSFGGPGWDSGLAVTVDELGNVYTTGTFTETVDFDPGPGTWELTSAGGRDVFVSKLNPAGELLWARAVGGPEHDESRGIAVDAHGNVYVSGAFRSTADFDPGETVFELSSEGETDVFLLKLTSAGNLAWAKRLGGTEGVGVGGSLVLDQDGDIHITGSFRGTADFDPGADSLLLTSDARTDIYVARLDTHGNLVWARQMTGTGEDDNFAGSLMLDQAGNVYTAGAFWGTIDFDSGEATAFRTSEAQADLYLHKLDSDGQFAAVYQMGGPGTVSWVAPLALDPQGNLIVAGTFYESIDFDPGEGSAILDSASAAWAVFVVKLREEALPGDFSGDGRVGLDDLLILLDEWGSTYGLEDLLDLLDNWGTE